jgi:hypothetical protein
LSRADRDKRAECGGDELRVQHLKQQLDFDAGDDDQLVGGDNLVRRKTDATSSCASTYLIAASVRGRPFLAKKRKSFAGAPLPLRCRPPLAKGERASTPTPFFLASGKISVAGPRVSKLNGNSITSAPISIAVCAPAGGTDAPIKRTLPCSLSLRNAFHTLSRRIVSTGGSCSMKTSI